jgi:hypothetical protein
MGLSSFDPVYICREREALIIAATKKGLDTRKSKKNPDASCQDAVGTLDHASRDITKHCLSQHTISAIIT